MQKTIFLIAFLSLFYKNVNAQEKSEYRPDAANVILKTSIGAFAEYATCLHLSAEVRPFKRFSLQTDFGYYSDFIRNPNYNTTTSRFDGVRFGGEARYYFSNPNEVIQSYIGLAYLTNMTNARGSANGLYLESGKVTDTQTAVSFRHERSFMNILVGAQFPLRKRLFLETSLGGGFVYRKVTDVQQLDTKVLLTGNYPNQILFPRNTLWTPSNYLDAGFLLDIAASLKVCYRIL